MRGEEGRVRWEIKGGRMGEYKGEGGRWREWQGEKGGDGGERRGKGKRGVGRMADWV